MININYAYLLSAEIGALERELFETDLQSIYDMDRDIRVAYVKSDNKIIAFLTFKLDGNRCAIYNLGVDEHHRRQGHGSTLICSLFDYQLDLDVRENNTGAIEFYYNHGFTLSHRRNNYYNDCDGLVLVRSPWLEEKAYAKVNLILNVLEKEDDGYHQIEFLMDSLELHDTVKITKSERDEVVVVDKPELSNLNNLGYRALELMREQYGFADCYKIEITKRIPVAAGMAGGSSDAAAVMRLLNKDQKLNLSLEQLSQLGAQVGSDVSYCIFSQLAIARGRGEQIKLVNAQFARKYVLVVNPGVELSTAAVYNNHQINQQFGNIEHLLNAQTHQQFEDNLSNSLTETAKKLCPQIDQLISCLGKLTTRRIILSGSGPTVLIFSEDIDELENIKNQICADYPLTYLTRMK